MWLLLGASFLCELVAYDIAAWCQGAHAAPRLEFMGWSVVAVLLILSFLLLLKSGFLGDDDVDQTQDT